MLIHKIEYFFVTLLILSASISRADKLNENFSVDLNCKIETAADSNLRSEDFIWNYSLALMAETFEKIYSNVEKRLPRRAYWNSEKNSLLLPYNPDRGGDVRVNVAFINNIVGHIETAFAKKYVDHVFFPDMGHSHLLVPEKKWQKIYDHYPVNQFGKLYEDLFKDNELKILYHTAEQLQTLDENNQVLPDPKIKWRFQTRNIVGLNNGGKDLLVLQNPDSKANTVGEVPGYFWYSSGFNISANKQGCFSYEANGQTYRFDLSLFDLE